MVMDAAFRLVIVYVVLFGIAMYFLFRKQP